MNTQETRKQIAELISKTFKNSDNTNDFDFNQLQQQFLGNKTELDKEVSEEGQKLVKKIYGADYRCVYDDSQFSNANIKALTLITFQIAFQDQYTATLLLTQLKNSIQYFSQLTNHPLLKIVDHKILLKIITHCLLQLSDISQQNPEISIRSIISAYSMGLQMFSLILRIILIKLKFSGAQDFKSQYIKEKTPEIFTILCEYLDLNLIAKNPKNKGSNNSSQVYLFSDYNLFITTHDNQEFLCGIYYENQGQMQEENMTSSQMQNLLGKSTREENDFLTTKRSTLNNPMRTSQFSLDLGMSGSGFIFPSQQQDTPFFNSNAPTPQFGFQGGLESLKLRKSIQKDPIYLRGSYFSIKEEQEHEGAYKNEKNEVKKKKWRQEFQQNTTSIIIDRHDEEDQKGSTFNNTLVEQNLQANMKKSLQSKDYKQPKSPPTLAGVAELNYFKIKKKTKIQEVLMNQNDQKKQQKKNNSSQNFQKLLKSLQQPNKQKYSAFDEKPRNHKGSYNQVYPITQAALLKNIKKSDITNEDVKNSHQKQRDKSLKKNEEKIIKNINLKEQSFEFFMKKAKQRQHKFEQKKDKSAQKYSQKSYSPKSTTSKKNKGKKQTKPQQPSINNLKYSNARKNPNLNTNFRKYSEYKDLNSLTLENNKSQNLHLGLNLEKLKGNEKQIKIFNEFSIKNNSNKIQNKKQPRVSSLKSFDSKAQFIKKSPDTHRCDKKEIKFEAGDEKNIKIGKFPEFLRKNTNITKKAHQKEDERIIPEKINNLIFMNNKRSSQEQRIKIVNSPREQNPILEKKIKKQVPTILNIQSQLILQKNKYTQSQPSLLINLEKDYQRQEVPQFNEQLKHINYQQIKRPLYTSSHQIWSQQPIKIEEINRNRNFAHHTRTMGDLHSYIGNSYSSQQCANNFHMLKEPYIPGKYLNIGQNRRNFHNDCQYCEKYRQNVVYEQRKI